MSPPVHSNCFCNAPPRKRSEEHTSELQSHSDLVCRLLLEKKKKKNKRKKLKPALSYYIVDIPKQTPLAYAQTQRRFRQRADAVHAAGGTLDLDVNVAFLQN